MLGNIKTRVVILKESQFLYTLQDISKQQLSEIDIFDIVCSYTKRYRAQFFFTASFETSIETIYNIFMILLMLKCRS